MSTRLCGRCKFRHGSCHAAYRLHKQRKMHTQHCDARTLGWFWRTVEYLEARVTP